MIVRQAIFSDILPLLKIVKAFIDESNWGWKFNEENSLKILYNYMNSDESCVLVPVDRNIVGFATIAFDDEFHDERLGYISKFYVTKEARGTGAGRALIAACDAWFKANKCDSAFATSTANIGEGALFKNLLFKNGYAVAGESLTRKFIYE